jgi:hypothetical protein
MCGARHDRRERERPTFVADDTRASDAERDEIITHLRAHAAEGRLTTDELDERVAAALAASTRAELAQLIADLPRPPRRPRDHTAERREHVRTYVSVMLLLVAIWALTGAGYFWPIWPMVGWGLFVLPDALLGTRRTSRAASAR